MKSSNHALEELLRRHRDEARRAYELGDPPKPRAASLKPSLIDKARLLLRVIQLIKTMKKSSWKTTVGGLLIAAGQAVPSILPPAWHFLGGTLTGIGGLVLGMAAADQK